MHFNFEYQQFIYAPRKCVALSHSLTKISNQRTIFHIFSFPLRATYNSNGVFLRADRKWAAFECGSVWKKSQWNVCNVWNWIACSLRIHWMKRTRRISRRTKLSAEKRSTWIGEKQRERIQIGVTDTIKLLQATEKIKRYTHRDCEGKETTFLRFFVVVEKSKLIAASTFIDPNRGIYFKIIFAFLFVWPWIDKICNRH